MASNGFVSRFDWNKELSLHTSLTSSDLIFSAPNSRGACMAQRRKFQHAFADLLFVALLHVDELTGYLQP